MKLRIFNKCARAKKQTEERRPIDVAQNILAIAPEKTAQKIRSMLSHAAPESILYNLSEIVQENIAPRSDDPVAVTVYAELCGISLAAMKEKIIERGD